MEHQDAQRQRDSMLRQQALEQIGNQNTNVVNEVQQQDARTQALAGALGQAAGKQDKPLPAMRDQVTQEYAIAGYGNALGDKAAKDAQLQALLDRVLAGKKAGKDDSWKQPLEKRRVDAIEAELEIKRKNAETNARRAGSYDRQTKNTGAAAKPFSLDNNWSRGAGESAAKQAAKLRDQTKGMLNPMSAREFNERAKKFEALAQFSRRLAAAEAARKFGDEDNPRVLHDIATMWMNEALRLGLTEQELADMDFGDAQTDQATPSAPSTETHRSRDPLDKSAVTEPGPVQDKGSRAVEQLKALREALEDEEF